MTSPELAKTHEYIDTHFPEHLAAAQELIRTPSVSATGQGIKECAELVLNNLKSIGCENTRIVKTEKHPIVYGELFSSNENARSIIFYSMYDVQPPEPLNEWKVPAFSGEIIDYDTYGKCIVSRGANNTKCPMIQGFKGIESVKKVTGTVPLNVYFVIEGEEEIGSPSLPLFLKEQGPKIKKVDVVWISLSTNRPHVRSAKLGFKGMAQLELEAKGGDWGGPTAADIHSRHASWVDSPVWRLIHALATLKDENENIEVDGFFEGMNKLTNEELDLVQELATTVDLADLQKETGVKKYRKGDRPKAELLKDYLFEPTINVQSIRAGFTEGEFKTIIPYRAIARLDMRLRKDMDPDRVTKAVRRHLDKHGYSDIKFNNVRGYTPIRTPISHPFAQAVLKSMSAHEDMGREVWPTWPGSAPFAFFAEPPINASVVATGFSFGGRNHAPNEFHSVGTFKGAEKVVSTLLFTYASQVSSK